MPKAYLPQFLLPHTLSRAFNRKLQYMSKAKKKKKQSQETKGPLDPDLGHEDVVIIRTRI